MTNTHPLPKHCIQIVPNDKWVQPCALPVIEHSEYCLKHSYQRMVQVMQELSALIAALEPHEKKDEHNHD